MTCVELRSWILACDAPGCDATATGEGADPWPEGWDSYFVEDAGLTAREAVRHACPAHAAARAPVPTRPTCQHEWFGVLPPADGRECERCRTGRQPYRSRLRQLLAAEPHRSQGR